MKRNKILIILSLLFLTSCTSFLPSFNDYQLNKTEDTSKRENIDNENYIDNSDGSNVTTPIQTYCDIKNSTVRIFGYFKVNSTNYETSCSGFIYKKDLNTSTNKNIYYVVTSASGLFYRYINSLNNTLDYDTDVIVVREGNFDICTDDGKIFIGEVVGYFDSYDICVMKFETARNYEVLETVDSKNINIGNTVYLCGTPTEGYNLLNTLLKGTVSGLNRLTDIGYTGSYQSKLYGDKITSYPTFQIDASINSGMEGGPVVNSDGKVLGMIGYRHNTTYQDYSYESISFAISSNDFKPIVESIISTGSFTKPLLGIQVLDLFYATTNTNYDWIRQNEISSGVLICVDGVSATGAAGRANIPDNSVIVSIVNNGTTYDINNLSTLYSCLVQIDASKSLTVSYYHLNSTLQSSEVTIND